MWGCSALFLKSLGCYDTVLNAVNNWVGVEENDWFLRPFTHNEFKTALWKMHPDKSPRPDGLNPYFYQKNLASHG